MSLHAPDRRRFPLHLSQLEIDSLSKLLHQHEVMLNIAAPGGMVAESTAEMLNTVCSAAVAGGADDPWPYRSHLHIEKNSEITA